MADAPPKRLQSQTERDVAGYAALKERRRSPPAGVPVEFPDEITGNYEGQDLARMRARRPTDKRLELVETKHDVLAKDVGELRVQAARIEGKLDVLPRLLELVEGKQTAANLAHANEHETKRHGMAHRTKVVLGILGVITTGLGIVAGLGIGGCT